MKVEELERVTFTQSTITEESEKLATNASQVLGYKKLARAVAAPTSLGYALKELDIAPLTMNSVNKYKRSKEKLGMWSGYKQGIACLAVIPVNLAIIKVIGGLLPPTASQSNFFQGTLVGVSIALVIASIICFARSIFCFFDSDMRGKRKSTTWQYVSLNGYQGAIPEYVLSKAIEIKKQYPLANFAIDQLFEQTEHTPIRQRDPFLVAHTSQDDGSNRYYDYSQSVSGSSELYYIDVWDEKEYERTM